MSDRFKELKKLPQEPCARILAARNMRLKTKLDAPASAGLPEVLAELEAKEAWVDMAVLLASALPGREATWWACLAARDVIGDAQPTPCLKAAEDWVFDPKDSNRERAMMVLQNASIDDPATHCATAAFYAPGDMGPGDLSEYKAPPAAVVGAVFTMNMKALKGRKDPMGYLHHLIDRALDIAAGGNGKIPSPAETAEPGGAA